MARPTKQTPELMTKLEQAFSLGCSNPEACFYAGISESTFYEWIKADKKLSERFKALKNKPVLKARQTIVSGLDDPANAKWYLERVKRDEFSTKVEQDFSSSDGSMATKETVIMTKEEYLQARREMLEEDDC